MYEKFWNMFFINLYSSIDRFLIRTRVKYPETLKDNNFKIPRSIFFFNLAQYSSMDRRTIVPILSNLRHFSMLLQFILNVWRSFNTCQTSFSYMGWIISFANNSFLKWINASFPGFLSAIRWFLLWMISFTKKI
jgi:hypothetical protein